MNKGTVSRLLLAAALFASVAPSYAIDYQAKPIMWCIQAPVRLVAATSAALICGGINGPIDDSYHWFLKGTKHVAGKFGDENGAGQIAMAVPIGGTTGAVLGAGYGVLDGAWHGFKTGWNKPFSRWSYITSEEK
jgi:hypothetical protein